MVNHPPWHTEEKAPESEKFASRCREKLCALSHFIAIYPGIDMRSSVKRATILNDLSADARAPLNHHFIVNKNRATP
jgi:hypothetical protein